MFLTHNPRVIISLMAKDPNLFAKSVLDRIMRPWLYGWPISTFAGYIQRSNILQQWRRGITKRVWSLKNLLIRYGSFKRLQYRHLLRKGHSNILFYRNLNPFEGCLVQISP